MARRKPDDDPRVTDLREYRKARKQAARRPPPRQGGPPILGSHPRAGLILALVILVLAVLYVVPRFLH